MTKLTVLGKWQVSEDQSDVYALSYKPKQNPPVKSKEGVLINFVNLTQVRFNWKEETSVKNKL